MQTSISPRLIFCGTLAATFAFAQTGWVTEKSEPAPTAAQAEQDAAEQIAPWSEAVNGLQARIELKPSRIEKGTPIIATYLHLRNVTEDGQAIRVPWVYATKLRVVDAAGKDLRKGGFQSKKGLRKGPPRYVVVPYHGSLSVDISANGDYQGADPVAAIDLSGGGWVLYKKDGACSLHGVLGFGDRKEGDPPTGDWHGRIELPPVAIPLTVEPPDPATADALIRALGQKMLSGKGRESCAAGNALSLIADDRVIPWYVKAMATKDYALRRAAVDRLSTFKGEEAFGALKKGLTTQAADILYCDSPEMADQFAKSIRRAAAVALTRSPHQDAKRELLNLWNDSDPVIRITVVQTLGKFSTEGCLALLKRMSRDSDPNVRVAIVQTLGKMKTEGSLALLKRMSEDSEERVHGTAQRYFEHRAASAATPAVGGEKK